MNKIIVFFLVGLLLCSCTPEEKVLKDRIDFLISNIDESEIDDLYGFSATARGKDDKGSKYLREIIYVNENKERFTIPSFQTLGDKKIKPISSYDFASFGKEFEISEDDSILFAKKIANQVIDVISNYKLYGIRSFKNQGKYIEFELSESQSVYYVKNKNELNQMYLRMINQAYEVKPSWYILNRKEHSKKIIELYKKN